jgi:cell division protease FtsH
MLAILAVSALTVLVSPAPVPDPSQVCAETVASTRPIFQAPAYVPSAARDQLIVESLGDEYVLCLASKDAVRSVVVLRGDTAIADLADGSSIEFALPTQDPGKFVAALAAAGVPVRPGSTPPISLPEDSPSGSKSDSPPILPWLLVGTVPLGAWLLWRRRRPRKALVHRTASQGSPLRSRERESVEDVPSTRFSDVAGHTEAVEDLAEMVDVLRFPDRYASIGARPPRGALLVGPPGTGKTLLARAVAGEAGVPFYTAAGSDFVELYVGVGARRVRDVFEKARKAGRAIVFIDEIDAVGRRRSAGAASGGDHEIENTLVALLNELDGFASTDVLVLAATNRPDVLDPALTRPGRLDRKIHVGLPDAAARSGILKVHVRNKVVDPNVDFEHLAQRTAGMSGAQLAQVCNEAALLAARRAASTVSAEDFASAIEYVLLGRARRTAQVSDADRRIVAWHEAGHTVAALTYPGAQAPVAVSITPRGAAGGVTWIPAPDSQLLTRPELRARLVVALAGRVAEERLLDGEHTAGAADDLAQATDLAATMVQRLGMSEFSLAVRSDSEEAFRSVDSLLREAYTAAQDLLEKESALLDAVASELLAHQDLTSEMIQKLAQDHRATR